MTDNGYWRLLGRPTMYVNKERSKIVQPLIVAASIRRLVSQSPQSPIDKHPNIGLPHPLMSRSFLRFDLTLIHRRNAP